MKLSVSNIAWVPSQEREVFPLLKEFGVTGIEIAPTKIWERPIEVTEMQAKNIRDDYAALGFEVPAMQSLLFGCSDFHLFGSEKSRREMLEYLKKISQLGSWIGAKVLVFGSPKNRRRGRLSMSEAHKISVPFFRELGDCAANFGVAIGIEANASGYGCDYINKASEAAALVSLVDSPGFVLHLDLGNMAMEAEASAGVLEFHLSVARHFHVSAPLLAPLSPETPGLDDDISLLLNSFGRFISLEARCAKVEDLRFSLTTMLKWLSRSDSAYS